MKNLFMNRFLNWIAKWIRKVAKIYAIEIEKAFSSNDLRILQQNIQEMNVNLKYLHSIQAEILRTTIISALPDKRLEHFEHRVYSQNGEDGIISELFKRIGIQNRIFVEFGIEDGRENNTVFLLSQGWKGLWVEGNSEYCQKSKTTFSHYIDSGDLFIKHAFITRKNINSLIEDCFSGDIDLLSIDIDSTDYEIWKAIKCISPRLLIMEYNAKFGPDVDWHLEYIPTQVWNGDDYFGLSLHSAQQLSEEKGYVLVGTEFCGNNAFFIRKDVFELNKEKFNYPLDTHSLYNPARYVSAKMMNGHPNSGKFPRFSNTNER